MNKKTEEDRADDIDGDNILWIRVLGNVAKFFFHLSLVKSLTLN